MKRIVVLFVILIVTSSFFRITSRIYGGRRRSENVPDYINTGDDESPLEIKTNWLIWKPVFANVATLTEMRKNWTLSDLLDCHEILLMKEKQADCIKKQWAELPIRVSIASDNDLIVMGKYNDFFGQEIFVEDPDGDVVIEYTDILEKTEGDHDGNTIIFGDENGITGAYVQIDKNATAERGQCILAHELGHVLGAHHESSGLMAFDSECSDEYFLDKTQDAEFLQWLFENYKLTPFESDL